MGKIDLLRNIQSTIRRHPKRRRRCALPAHSKTSRDVISFLPQALLPWR
jgi:hypothetical protein